VGILVREMEDWDSVKPKSVSSFACLESYAEYKSIKQACKYFVPAEFLDLACMRGILGYFLLVNTAQK
jgi:hypothetical protein